MTWKYMGGQRNREPAPGLRAPIRSPEKSGLFPHDAKRIPRENADLSISAGQRSGVMRRPRAPELYLNRDIFIQKNHM
jgi:hypothetical protein